MTEDQVRYYKAMKAMQNKKPSKSIPRPSVIHGLIYACAEIIARAYAVYFPNAHACML